MKHCTKHPTLLFHHTGSLESARGLRTELGPRPARAVMKLLMR